jgi:hypothetical protein
LRDYWTKKNRPCCKSIFTTINDNHESPHSL